MRHIICYTGRGQADFAPRAQALKYKSLTVIVVLALGGCSAMLDLPVQQSDPTDSPESYYKQLVVASDLPRTLIAAQPSAPVQISALRRSVAPQPGDWMTCLRTVVKGRVKYLAVFFRNRAVIDSRSDVEIDGCETEQYAPLPLPEATNRDGGATAAPPSGHRRPVAH